MTRTFDVDYLVVGAGAMGMAFTDALIDHADARVALVDRRHGAGGHWLDAYPFVRLHQASSFYGVASTILGATGYSTAGPRPAARRATGRDLRLLQPGPDRPDAGSDRVEFLPNSDYVGDRTVVSLVSGTALRRAGAMSDRRRALPRPRHPG